ncbi:hypothetical protein QUA30_10410 [Microcoleus sp. Pol14C2]|uniref:hypothetical protein n=1 Tax=unclassified Microcoleus TaxID=2642155 RepID=UPI002FD362EA
MTDDRPLIRLAVSVKLSFGGWVKSFQIQVAGQILAGFINYYQRQSTVACAIGYVD